MSKIKTVRHIVNKKDGKDEDGNEILKRIDSVEYEFGDEVSPEAKKKVRNHVPKLTTKKEIKKVIDSLDGET